MSEHDLAKVREAMNWVIPADSSPGAGTEAGLTRLLELVDSQDPSVAAAYRSGWAGLREADLADSSNRFAAMFVEHVRDVYYAYPETGSWSDIGFKVTG